MTETPDPGVVPHDPEGPTRVSRILPKAPEPRAALFRGLKWVFVVALIGVFVYAAAEELRTFHWHDVREAFGKIDRVRVAKALGFLAANYLILTLYDWASFRVLGLKRAWHLVAPRAAAAFAFSNFVGLGFVSGAAVRLRLYKDLVDSPATLARVIALNSISLWSGLLLICGLALCFCPVSMDVPGHVGDLRHLWLLFLAVPVLWMTFAATQHWLPGPFKNLLRLPPARTPQIALLLAIAAADWITFAGVFLSILGPRGQDQLTGAATGFWLSHLFAMLSFIPSGLAVFEAAITHFVGPVTGEPAAVLAAALGYRVLYYLFPWLTAVVALGMVAALPPVARFVPRLGRAVGVPVLAERLKKLEPTLQEILTETLAILAFVAGAVLWISAAVPALRPRVDFAEQQLHLPQAILAATHFSSVVVGAVLILVSFGLQHRHRESWVVTEAALIAGAIFTFLKGLDFEEAGFLLLVALVFYWARDKYDRRGRALNPRILATAWGAALVCAVAYVAIGVWIHRDCLHALIVHRMIEPSEVCERLKMDTPLFLRSLLPVSGLIAWLVLAVRWSGDRPPAPPPGEEDLAVARKLLAQHASTSLSLLSTLGDKSLWFSPKKDGFIAWQRRGSTILALGDPVGPTPVARDLIREFRRFADEWDVIPAFYEVAADRLADYHALGFSFFQLGEEAFVDLATFSVKGDPGKSYRSSLNRATREGLTFEIVPPVGTRDDAETRASFSELKAISDEWLADKAVAEKRFSMGYWDEGYLRECPIAVVRQGPVIGFANILATPDKQELSVDLMRHKKGELENVMDFLFINLLLWGKEQGYRVFNLGMSPLAGVGEEAFAKPLERAARLLFLYGEHFYNFRGLRRFKEKYRPRWEPRYLAAPAEWQVPRVLVDAAAITSGGYSRIVRR